VKAALGGDGGDELFAGYPTYPAHKAARWIPQSFARPSRFLSNLLPVSDKNISFDFKLRRFTSGLAYPFPARHQIWLGSFEPHQKKSLLTVEFQKQLNRDDEFSLLDEHLSSCDSTHYLNRAGCADMRFYLQDDILTKVDRMSMANSLEVRSPFLDHKLVDFAASLNPNFKLKGFGVPIAKWIKTDLKELFLDVLDEGKIKSAGLFNPSYVKALMNEHLSGRRDHRKLLWTLFVFETWRQRIFSAGKSPSFMTECRQGKA